MNRRMFAVGLLALPMFRFDRLNWTVTQSEAFRKLHKVMTLRDWWRTANLEALDTLARDAGFSSLVGNVLLDLDGERSATITEEGRVHYITKTTGVQTFRNVDEAIVAIYGVNTLL